MEHLQTDSPRATGHSVRAWCYLVWLCIQRQARFRQMVWIALGLLALAATMVTLQTLQGRWGMGHWRWVWIRPAPSQPPPSTASQAPPKEKGMKDAEEPRPDFIPLTYNEAATGLEQSKGLGPLSPAGLMSAGVRDSLAAGARDIISRSGFYVFSNWFVFSLFLSFLLPIWTLSFATEALGGEREGRNLIWLLMRPLPRPLVYLAKFVALLPWSLALNVGGFGLLCLLAGPPGFVAFRLYWPAVLAGTLAFCSVFHLLAACFQRAAVVALVYCFFLETLLGNMPGYMKRISIAFYTKCMMFEAAGDYNVHPEKPSIYLPVDGTTAGYVLMGVTAACLLLGMAVFSRTEYQDLA